jgi:hypothetical protein
MNGSKRLIYNDLTKNLAGFSGRPNQHLREGSYAFAPLRRAKNGIPMLLNCSNIPKS